jgi:hypothetical protein
MDQVQMKGIHLFIIIFPETLPINYTTLKLATYLEVALGNTKYHHQDSGIPNTGFMLILLYHGSRTSERDPYMYNNISGEFAHKLHYFEVGHLGRSRTRDQAKQGPGRMKTIADPMLFNQLTGMGMEEHTKRRSLFHFTCK